MFDKIHNLQTNERLDGFTCSAYTELIVCGKREYFKTALIDSMGGVKGKMGRDLKLSLSAGIKP